jgi:uncharacterized protein (DUF4415 family)
MTNNAKDTAKHALDLIEPKPELDDDWFAEADAYIGTKLIRRGRPRLENPKQPVSLRLDRDVIEWFKGKGDGWQTRINEELRRVAGLG